MQEEQTLVLEITDQESHLAMSLFYQDELSSTVRYYHQRVIDLAYVEKMTREVTSLLNKTHLVDPEGSRLLESLQKAGQTLWDHLLAKQVKEKIRDAVSCNLVLVLDESLIRVPWELLFDGAEFLCLKFSVGRLVKTSRNASSPRYRDMHPHLKMLIIANPTNDLKAAYQEGIHVRDYIDHARKEILVDFKSTQVDTVFLKKNLRDYDIVHFAGHCQYDELNRSRMGWVLQDGILTIKDIMELGEGSAMPSIVFSNACQSAQVAPDTLASDYQHRTYSLAGAFLFSGVRHYIGSIWKIDDQVSLAFAKSFYQALVHGKSTGACVRAARLAVAKRYGMAHLAWASYLLYGDPSFVLLHKLPPRSGATKGAYAPAVLRRILLRAALAIAVIGVCYAGYCGVVALNPSERMQGARITRLLAEGKNDEVISRGRQLLKECPHAVAAYPVVAQALERTGNPQEAQRLYFAYALESEKSGNAALRADAYLSLGWFFQGMGEYDKAIQYYQLALDLARRTNDPLHEAVALRKCAVWNIDKGLYATALELLTKSAEINRRFPRDARYRYNLACDYFDIGLVFINKDDLAAGKDFYKKSYDLFTGLKKQGELSDYYCNLGEIYQFEKQFQKAKECYLLGLSIDRRMGDMRSEGADYAMLGDLSVEMGQNDEAEKYFLRAAGMAKVSGSRLSLAEAYHSLAHLYMQTHKVPKAKEFLRQAQELYHAMGLPEYQKIKEEFAQGNE